MRAGGRRRRRPRRRRGRAGRDGRLGRQAPADVRGRRARALLRPARLRDDAAAALRRAALGARRGAAGSSSSTGRRPRRGRSTPRRRSRPARRHACAAASAPTGRRLLDIADETLDGTILDGAAVGDFLLEELERNRDAHMRDIVATIQADQYRLITHDPTAPLVIQGGPGTGKTAVGLHRASWLLYTHREHLRAPRRARRRPEPHVHGVRLARAAGARRGRGRAARGLASSSTASCPSCATRRAVAELKADLRLAEVVRRAAELRLVSEPEELVLRLEGSFVSVRLREVRELLDAAREPSTAPTSLGTRALPDEPAAPLLRGVRAGARRRRDPQLRRGRAGAPREAATSTAC